MRIGIVCEGSHDFNVINVIVRKFCNEHQLDVGAIDCLQPTLSASFDQVGGGGWGRVKLWCESGDGTGFRVFLDEPLFATSIPYNLIVIHLDGDVYEHCEEGALVGVSCDDADVEDIATALQKTIRDEWMSVAADDEKKLLFCTPVRHLEAWLLAALDEASSDTEARQTKDEFRARFSTQYPKKTKTFYIQAAQDAVRNIERMRAKCLTFRNFENSFLSSEAARTSVASQ